VADVVGRRRAASPGSTRTSGDAITRRPRLLLLAYGCSPYRGSEPGAGWHTAAAAGRYGETWVVCEGSPRHVAHIGEWVRRHGPVPGVTFRFLAHTPFEHALRRLPGGVWPAYHLWHRRAWRVAARLHRRVGFDLVHQVSLNTFREPGYLWRLDAPFVWGPLGGTQNYPPRFLLRAGAWGAVCEGLRSLANTLQLRLDPRVRRAARRAAAVLASTSTVQRDLARALGVHAEQILDAGLDAVAEAPPPLETRGPLRLLWCGGLVRRKALHLLLHALALAPAGFDFRLRIVGDGPMARPWRRLARRLGLADRCDWRGQVPHQKVPAHYDWADVLAFTSLRDTSGNVVLEALGRGRPVVCFDHQGARDMVDGSSGIRIPVTRPDETVAALREVLVRLARNPILRENLSRRALERARRFLWSRRGERLAEVYRRVLAGRGTGPW